MCLTAPAHLFNTNASLMKRMFMKIQIECLHIYFTELILNIKLDYTTETSQHLEVFIVFFLTNEFNDFDAE